jgi:hypothetical protein
MTVQPCPDCGKEISKRALACPNCGRRIEFTMVVFSIIFWSIFAAVIFWAIVAGLIALLNSLGR